MASPQLKHQDYTVGWICALHTELIAAMAMLDEGYDSLPQLSSDTNNYILGRIGKHNVVMACLPAGGTGTSSAAIVASQMKTAFRAIRFSLMVGIGGGVPSTEYDLRLGDVVVSKPSTQHGGVVQYDFGKTVSNGKFEHTGSLNRPPTVLLTALSALQAKHALHGNKLAQYIQAAEKIVQDIRSKYTYQGTERDELYEVGYDHKYGVPTCAQCDKTKLVQRPPRNNSKIIVHYGIIASGNQVMKHGVTRDRLAREFGILCFEMEAAGLMNDFPCVVIRGVCDYADSHKNKRWQEYAAITAAAYAKELISIIQPEQVVNTYYATPDSVVTIRRYPMFMLGIQEPGVYGFQEYWHPGQVLPTSRTAQHHVSYSDIQSLRTDITNSTSVMENELVHFMQVYRDAMINQLQLFPNANQQQMVFQLMVKASNGVITKDSETGRTLLHYMAMNGVEDVINALVNAGFNVNDKDSDYRTPLHLAVIGCHAEAVQVLIVKCNSNVHTRDLNKLLPWHCAIAIDIDNVMDNDQRVASKKQILRLLAIHTNLEEVKTKGPHKILKELKDNPSANIEVL